MWVRKAVFTKKLMFAQAKLLWQNAPYIKKISKNVSKED